MRASEVLRPVRLVTVGCALAAVLLAGLPTRASDPAASEEAADPATTHDVSQEKRTFAPGELTVRAGDEVRFLNDDEISHNVFSRSAGSKFNLKIQKPGEHKSHRFEKEGTVVVRCAIHPKMKLVVNVEPSAPAAESDAASIAAPGDTASIAAPAAPAAPGDTASITGPAKPGNVAP